MGRGAGSDGGAPTVDRDHRAREVARLVRRDEGDDVGDLLDAGAAPINVVLPSCSIRSGLAPSL